MLHHVLFGCSKPSAYLWEDAEGVVLRIHQGEGGEQGDPLMPLLFSVGQHDALSAIHEGMRVHERLFAYLDDIWLLIGLAICTILLNESCGTGQGSGSIPARHMSGTDPAGSSQLAMSCRGEPECWMKKLVCGLGQRFFHPTGHKVWGCPLGHVDFVRAQLEATTAKHSALFQAIPSVPDIQLAWLLLFHCASARANYQLRVLRPYVVEQFARTHDARVWQCLCDILKIPENFVGNLHKEAATLPLSLGSLGLRSAVRTSVLAHWASWADVLPMIRDRHHVVATTIVNALENDTASSFLGAASRAAQDLDGVEEFEVPQWRALQLVSVRHLGSPRSLNLGARELVGNTKHPAELNASSEETQC